MTWLSLVVTFLIAHVWSMLGVFNRPYMVDAGRRMTFAGNTKKTIQKDALLRGNASFLEIRHGWRMR